jgi:hypothetical protein
MIFFIIHRSVFCHSSLKLNISNCNYDISSLHSLCIVNNQSVNLMEVGPFWENRQLCSYWKTSPTFYRTRRFITVFKRSHDWSLAKTKSNQPTQPHPISLKIRFNIIHQPTPWSSLVVSFLLAFLSLFNWLNRSSRIITLVSNHPLRKMSSWDLRGATKGQPARKADKLTAIC